MSTIANADIVAAIHEAHRAERALTEVAYAPDTAAQALALAWVDHARDSLLVVVPAYLTLTSTTSTDGLEVQALADLVLARLQAIINCVQDRDNAAIANCQVRDVVEAFVYAAKHPEH